MEFLVFKIIIDGEIVFISPVDENENVVRLSLDGDTPDYILDTIESIALESVRTIDNGLSCSIHKDDISNLDTVGLEMLFETLSFNSKQELV